MVRPLTHYLICTTPRSGSTFLCAMLGNTGVAGMQRAGVVGHEYVLELIGRYDRWGARARLDRDDLGDFLRGAFDRSRTPNGVAGFKLMWDQVRRLARRLNPPGGSGRDELRDFAALLPEATRFVWLTRRERLRQAVSLVKAVQSACWNSAEQERFRGRYMFDYVGVERTVRMIERHDAMWGDFFARNGIEPLKVDYEDVVADRGAELRRILDFIDVRSSPGAGIDDVMYRRQSGAVNDHWVERVRQIRSWSPAVRRAYVACSVPRWVGLRALSRWRRARRIRRLPGGERLEPH